MTTVTFTSSGTFTVPAYSTMTVEVLGGQGTTGTNLTDPATSTVYTGGAGAAGGRSFKSYTFGAGPTPGASVAILIGATSRFTSGSYPTAYSGDNGQNAFVIPGDGDSPDNYYNGADGVPGTASGGDTNTTGGSAETAPKIVITYSEVPQQHLEASADGQATATAALRRSRHLSAGAQATSAAAATLSVDTPGNLHLEAAAQAQASGTASLRQTVSLASALLIGGVEAMALNAAYLTSLGSGTSGMSISIANIALDLLEEEPIVTADDNRAVVRWMTRNFVPIRDAMLRAHPWNFATRRTTLTRLEDAPAYGWASGYTKPSDCLRILPLTGDYHTGSEVPYTLEGQTILSNGTSDIRLLYIKRVVDDSEMDPIFVQALGATIAARAANFITGKQSYAKYCEELAARLTQQAQMVDALEGTPYNAQGEDWINARSGSVEGTYY